MLGFFLFILAFILNAIFTPLGIVFTFIKSILSGNILALNAYNFNLALSLDQFANVSMSALFNVILIRRDSKNKFGNPDETISSVLGKNQKSAKLVYLGKRLVALLDAIEKDHSLKSIDK